MKHLSRFAKQILKSSLRLYQYDIHGLSLVGHVILDHESFKQKEK